MTGEFSSAWLALREPADAEARAADLVDRLDLEPPLVIRDLGCGTGSLSRWLAPRLPGPQHWILMDADPTLLAHAAASRPAAVTVETVRGDVTALTADDLAGTSLVTCSALLDLLTADEVDALAAVCTVHRTPALFTLSVVGEVTFDPAEPLDSVVADAFNAHQRRTVGGRRLLGPDSAAAAEAAFRRHGATVEVRPAPWRLASDSALADEWLRGWVAAAQDQRPGLDMGGYASRRLRDAASVTVGHADLLATFD